MSRWAVINQAKRLRVCKRKFDISWKETEINIMKKFHFETAKSIANRLKKAGHPRTEDAVRFQMNRLKIKTISDYFTPNDIAFILGVCRGTVRRWLDSSKMLSSNRHVDKEHDERIIKRDELRRFILTYPTEIRPAYCDIVSIVDIVGGIKGKDGRADS